MVGLPWTAHGVVCSFYLNLCKSDHSTGGITFEAAKAVNFNASNTPIGSVESPATNLIVQVFKTVTWDKIPTNFLALIVAEVLTLAAGAAYAQIQGIAITWYLVFAAVVVGLLSAYAAMLGYDKLVEALKNWPKKIE